jgi:hypothetical protein
VYALRRIIAFVIDMAVILTPVGFFLGPLQARLGAALPSFWAVYSGFVGWVLSMAVPIAVVAVLLALTGRTPGKLVMFLRVTARGRHGRAKPSLPSALLRETVKAISMSFIFGALYAIYGIVTSGRAFYDDWLGLDVEDLRPSGLTDVQKNWRKQMAELRRDEE